MRNHPGALAALVASLAALQAVPAAAVDRLFPTDVVGSGEVDVQLDASWIELRNESGPFSFKIEGQQQQLQLQLGLTRDLEFGATLPYLTQKASVTFDGETEEIGEDSELLGSDFWLGYRFQNGPDLAIAGEYRFHSNTSGGDIASHELTLTFGTPPGAKHRFYGSIGFDNPVENEFSDSFRTSLGLYSTLSSTVRVMPEVFYWTYQESDFQPSSTLWGVSLAVPLQVGRNVNVIPRYEYLVHTIDGEDLKGTAIGLSLDFLFGAKPPARRKAPAQPVTEVVVEAPAPAPAPEPAAEVPPPATAPPALQTGGSFTFTKPTTAQARPDPASQTMGTFAPGSSALLKARMPNVHGVWWYVTSDGLSGWIKEAYLQ